MSSIMYRPGYSASARDSVAVYGDTAGRLDRNLVEDQPQTDTIFVPRNS